MAKFTKNNNISFEDFGKIVVTAIEDEPYLNKQTLVPKIKALAHGFKLNLNTTTYKSIENPSVYAMQLRNIEKIDFEKLFWQRKIKELNGRDVFIEQCAELKKLLIEYGFESV